MPREFGRQFPERELMSVISDLLGIPHYTTARGSTVRSDFLLAVAEALGVSGREHLKKDPLLAACVEAATERPMPASLYSPGGTVTNEALQVIIDGIIENRLTNRARAPEDVADEAFDPALLTDERDRRLVDTAIREGRDRFRARLMDAYSERCAVTGFDAVDALEAAHITPYRGPASNTPGNGLLLRADVHRLWDHGDVAVDEDTRVVLIKPHIAVTAYNELAGRRIRVPRDPRLHPAHAALRNHREWCGL